ncbi:MAG: hypothetical protein ACOCV2_08500 [Persicimonas sp.]
MERLLELVRKQRVRRVAIGTYVTVLIAILGAFFYVSMLEVEHAAYVQGAPTVERGRPNAMRALVLHAPSGRKYTDADLDVDLLDTEFAGQETLDRHDEYDAVDLTEGEIEQSGYGHLSIEAPDDWEPGAYTLSMRADGEGIEDYLAAAPVMLEERSAAEAPWPEESERLPEEDQRSDRRAADDRSGPIRIDLLPVDGEVPRGLESGVYIRTTEADTGAPVASRVTFTERDGRIEGELPDQVRTDQFGLARLKIAPVTDQQWTLEARSIDGALKEDFAEQEGEDDGKDEDDEEADDENDDGTSTADIDLTTVATQLSLQMHDVLAVGGESLEGGVESLSDSGGLFVELYNGDDWVDADAFGARADTSGVRVDVPELQEETPFYRAQVSQDMFGAGSAWDATYLVAADGTGLDDYREAARRVAEHVAEHTDDKYYARIAESDLIEKADSKTKLRRLTDAMLTRMPRHFEQPPILINSQSQAREALDEWKEDAKSDLMLMAAFALLIGLAVVGYAVVLGVQSYREQNRMLRDVDTELAIAGADADEPGGELDEAISHGNVVAGLQIFIVVMTLVMFSLGILLLLSYL